MRGIFDKIEGAHVKQKIAFLLTLVFVLTGNVYREVAAAASLAGVDFEESITHADGSLVLNGIGLRTKFFFKVYVAGLYVQKRSQDPETILQASTPKVLKLHFLRDVDGEDIKEAWLKGYKDNCLSQCETTLAQVNRINEWMRDMKKNETLTFRFVDEKIQVEVNGEEKGSIQDKDFATNILAIFIGKNPPNKELREGLLGRET